MGNFLRGAGVATALTLAAVGCGTGERPEFTGDTLPDVEAVPLEPGAQAERALRLGLPLEAEVIQANVFPMGSSLETFNYPIRVLGGGAVYGVRCDEAGASLEEMNTVGARVEVVEGLTDPYDEDFTPYETAYLSLAEKSCGLMVTVDTVDAVEESLPNIVGTITPAE